MNFQNAQDALTNLLQEAEIANYECIRQRNLASDDEVASIELAKAGKWAAIARALDAALESAEHGVELGKL